MNCARIISMRALIFSTPETKTDSVEVRELLRAVRVNNMRLETYDPNSKQGADLCETYGVMDYPAMVILSEDGVVRGFWQGMFPTPSEISLATGYV